MDIKKTLLVLTIVAGCSENHGDIVPKLSDGGTKQVEFILSERTRSILKTPEEQVYDLNLAAYCDGVLENSLYWDGKGPITMELKADCEYDFYAVANVGKVAVPEEEEGMEEFTVKISGLDDLRQSFPMAWRQNINSASTGMIYIELERLVSKVIFSFDPGENPELKVTSVRLRQSAAAVRPFCEFSSAEDVIDGDYASQSDIASVNSGGGICFYTLENCHGNLLKGNTDPWAKVPENVEDVSGDCTYLEVTCKAEGSPFMSGEVKYRMYLGRDNVTNFDVLRNTEMKLLLYTTREGMGHESWKIDCSALDMTRYLEFEPSVLNMSYGDVDTVHLRTNIGEYSLNTSRFEDLGLSVWRADGNDYVVKCKCWYDGGGTGVLTASGKGLTSSCTINVDNVPEGIHVPGDIIMAVGEARQVMIYPLPYEVDFHYMCECESSDTWVAMISGCDFDTFEIVAMRKGVAVITATFNDLSESFTVTVLDDPVPMEDLIVPDHFDVPYGGTAYCSLGVIPSNSTDGIIPVSSDEETAVVRMASNGILEVQGKKAGRCTVSLETTGGLRRSLDVYVTISAEFYMEGDEVKLRVQDAGQGSRQATILGLATVCSATHHVDMQDVPRNPTAEDIVRYTLDTFVSPGVRFLPEFSRKIDDCKFRASQNYEDNYVWTDVVSGQYYITRSYYYVTDVKLKGSTLKYASPDYKVVMK